jgi:hypothetical protein
MACSGTFCNQNSTGTTTCSNHRGPCATNRPLASSTEFALASGRIRQSDIEELRVKIRDELTRYKAHTTNSGTVNQFGGLALRQAAAYTTNTPVSAAHINDMELMTQQTINVTEPIGSNYQVYVNPADATTPANTYIGNTVVTATHWATLRDKYNIMRQDCICNSDCTCNAVCNCHRDCGCNYSDERLKQNIKFLGTREGINIYSYNYTWDQETKYIGVMAQEILQSEYSHAIEIDEQGFFRVHYDMLPNNGELWSEPTTIKE